MDDFIFEGINFRLIPGYERYACSRCGVVIARRGRCEVHKRRGRHNPLWDLWHALKQADDGKGYRVVSLGYGNRRSVHELMLATFVRAREPGEKCRHLNDIRTDNRLENLCYGSGLENAADALRNGLYHRGEKHYYSRLTENEVLAARELLRRHGTRSGLLPFLCRWFSVSTSCMHQAMIGKTWSHLPGVIDES